MDKQEQFEAWVRKVRNEEKEELLDIEYLTEKEIADYWYEFQYVWEEEHCSNLNVWYGVSR